MALVHAAGPSNGPTCFILNRCPRPSTSVHLPCLSKRLLPLIWASGWVLLWHRPQQLPIRTIISKGRGLCQAPGGKFPVGFCHSGMQLHCSQGLPSLI